MLKMIFTWSMHKLNSVLLGFDDNCLRLGLRQQSGEVQV